LTTKWDQGWPYNKFCPEDEQGPGGHALVGCVATAMAQIMKYHTYPEHGMGSHSYYHPDYGMISANFGETTYDWENMPDILTTASQTEIDAVALLSFHCGVSVDMNYGPEGSGAQSYAVKTSLINYFGYSPGAQYVAKSSYSDSAWVNLLKYDLDNHRPIYYAGRIAPNGEGHAFVCDGYKLGNYFHFNWGWEGYSDGYYYLNNLNPGGYNFTYSQKAIVHIKPAYINANFAADHIVGVEPFVVQFTDFSDGNPTTWRWDFNNDGQIDSYEQNPECTYLEPGIYTVSLSISDGTDSDTMTKTDYIKVTSSDEIQGFITENRVLYDDTVRVKGDVTVTNGVTLTIEPGVVLEFDGYYKLDIKGQLIAIGTEQDSIVFTVEDTTGFFNLNNTSGGWNGIFLNNVSSTEDSTKLIYCKLEYVKKSTAVNIWQHDNVLISSCEISDCFGIGISCWYTNSTIKNSVIRDITAYPSFMYDGWGCGINCYSSNSTISNVLISENLCRSKGTIFLNNSNPTLINVTISDNLSSIEVEGAIVCGNNSNPNLINTVLCNDDFPEIFFRGNYASNSTAISYSNIQGGESGIVTNNNGTVNWLSGNMSANPQFVYEGEYPYSLQAWSRCINAGMPDTSGLNPGNFDLAGNPRVYGESIDIGAYEFQGEPIIYNVGFSVADTSDTVGVAPFSVQFIDTSSCSGITGWTWDFDNNGTPDSEEQSPLFEYSTPGLYSVTLIVHVGEDPVKETKINYITVLNANPIVQMPLDTINIIEDKIDSTLSFNEIFIDPNGDDLAFSYEGNENIGVEITDEQVILIPEENWFGIEKIAFIATDFYGASVSDTLTVNVLPVNDPPFFTDLMPDTVIFNADTTDTLLIGELVEDIDTPDSCLEWLLIKSNFVQFKIDTILNVGVFWIENNQSGLDTVVLGVTDTEFTIYDTIIAFSNAAPIVQNPLGFITIMEDKIDSTVYFDNVFIDPNSDELTFSCDGNEHISIEIIDKHLILMPYENWFGNEKIILTANDPYEALISDTLTVNVFPVNDAPYFTKLMPDTISINTGEMDTLMLEGLSSDVDNPDSSLSWSFVKSRFVMCEIDTVLNMAIFSTEWSVSGLDTVVLGVSDTNLTVYDSIFVLVKPAVLIDKELKLIPENYCLFKNYPNPFNPTTIIKYQLPKSSFVMLEVYNITGQLVQTLVKEQESGGYYSIEWNGLSNTGRQMPTGVYIYRITTGNFVSYKKMLLMR